MKMNKMIWIVAAATTASALCMGFTLALLAPQTGERIRSTCDVAIQQWRNGEVRDTELTAIETLRRQKDLAEAERDQALIDLGNILKLAESDREVQRLGEERARLAEELAEALILDRLSRPLLMLAPTPAGADSEPKEKDTAAVSIGTQRPQQGDGA